MEKLTAKEEEVLGFFWKHGAMPVRDIVKLYDAPKPHFNTVSTIVRSLEEKGYVGHTPKGKSFIYHAIVGEEVKLDCRTILQELISESGFIVCRRRQYPYRGAEEAA